jgi:hypothetical protein
MKIEDKGEPRRRSVPAAGSQLNLPTDAATGLLATTGDAFTQAMGIGLVFATALAAATAVVVRRFLPADEPVAGEAEGAEPDLRLLADRTEPARP